MHGPSSLMYAKASKVVYVYRGSEQRYGHNPWLRVGRIPPHDKHFQKLNNFEDGTLLMYQYTVHKLEFLLLEALNLNLILPNVILPVSPPSISLIWFRTTIIGNIRINNK